MGYQMVTWPMTSRDPQTCCEAVRSAILATAWLLVFVRITVTEQYRANCLAAIAALMYIFYSRRNSQNYLSSIHYSIRTALKIAVLKCRKFIAIN